MRSTEVVALDKALGELINRNAPIELVSLPYAEVLSYFESHSMESSAAIVKSRVREFIDVHRIEGCLRLAVFPLVGSTGGLDPKPHLAAYQGGLVAVYYNPLGPLVQFTPSRTLMTSFKEQKQFGLAHGVTSIGALNVLKNEGREFQEFVLHCEFAQEAKLAHCAERIRSINNGARTRVDAVGVICIAGPTSSGKTTFATKLSMYLANAGYKAVPLSVDHYYLPLDRQPRYQIRGDRGDVDYDAIESMDIPLVSEHVNALLRGQTVMTPVYNMKTGFRDGPGKPFCLPGANSILVMEGIHSLNPTYTSMITETRVFKIYISPLSALQIDETHALRTTDHRLLRRMCRDYLFRGHSASRTLSMWDKVRRGEHRWIFPHQDNVDWVVNSGCEYELRILKPLVEPLLAQVQPADPCFRKAQSLLSLLSQVNAAPCHVVPSTSLVREFIGDGAFDHH
mmetsp:Transcript_23000/g.62441  ORF Transcript_23000/g.62441 Transcript_23000/m.62441 type:complete len:453 (-) Transcript_23000:293-1651(-)